MLVERLELDHGTLLDCFMGSGVTGTAAFQNGLSFAGIEAHPLIAELATLKLRLDVDPDDLIAAATDLVKELEPTSTTGETDLITRSFSGEVLSELVSIREAVKSLPEDEISIALKWALLATLRDVAGVKVGWPYQRPGVSRIPRHRDASARFIARVNAMSEDFRLPRLPEVEATIVIGDSAEDASWTPLPEGDGCITSPPYLNNFDYADATRLELFFWGEVRTWRDMCETVRSNMVVATTQQSSKGSKEESLEILAERGDDVGEKVIALTSSVRNARTERGGRTKEYDQVLPSYFVSMSKILGNLYNSLRAGSKAIWLVGDSAPYDVYVDTPDLIGQLAQAQGFALHADIRLRERGARWNRTRSHALSERMVIFSKPDA
jgi:hypothetical protein